MAEGAAGRDAPDVSRRGFVGWAIGLGSAFAAAVVGIPMLGMLLGATPKSAQASAYTTVTDMASLVTGEVTGLTFIEESVDGYVPEMLPHSVWVIKQSDTDATVYSPICPHLGCQVSWDKGTQRFVCPCHGSIFTRDGTVVAGPSPRPLDTLPAKVDKGELLVQWVYYQLDTPVKVPV